MIMFLRSRTTVLSIVSKHLIFGLQIVGNRRTLITVRGLELNYATPNNFSCLLMQTDDAEQSTLGVGRFRSRKPGQASEDVFEEMGVW